MTAAGASRISHRELEVLALLATGLTNSDIGRKLYISEDTVKSHLRRAGRKLRAHNRVSMAMAAVRHGLVANPADSLQPTPPPPAPTAPRTSPESSRGLVTLRPNDHDAHLLATAWAGGQAPEFVQQRALTALQRLAGTEVTG